MPIAKEILSMFEFNRKPINAMNVLCRKKEVYPQIDKHFRRIDIYSSKAIARLPSLCGYTPLEKLIHSFISGDWNITGCSPHIRQPAAANLYRKNQ